jgi:hypothetical protein
MAKLKVARDRKSPRTGKARSLREMAAELSSGFTTASGNAFSASQVHRLVSY